jgi:hypothetical protein
MVLRSGSCGLNETAHGVSLITSPNLKELYFAPRPSRTLTFKNHKHACRAGTAGAAFPAGLLLI